MSILSPLMRALHKPVYGARLRALVGVIEPLLIGGDHVLDVGCGYGQLGKALAEKCGRARPIEVEGLERVKRGGELIPVKEYYGKTIPAQDGAYDVVILADVLHHEADPHRLLSECLRVSRRLVVIKDHAVEGPMAQRRIALIDWAANAPYGVPCLYRYNTVEQWRAWAAKHGAKIADEHTSMNLYPPLVNLLFGRRLQYLAVWERVGAPVRRPMQESMRGLSERLERKA